MVQFHTSDHRNHRIARHDFEHQGAERSVRIRFSPLDILDEEQRKGEDYLNSNFSASMMIDDTYLPITHIRRRGWVVYALINKRALGKSYTFLGTFV